MLDIICVSISFYCILLVMREIKNMFDILGRETRIIITKIRDRYDI